MQKVTVKLSKPITGHRGPIDKLVFREPLYADYMLLGDPRAPIISGERVYMRAIPETVGQYAERLLVQDNPADADVVMMSTIGLQDTLAVEKVILGFFQPADSGATETKTTSSSSSGGDSPS